MVFITNKSVCLYRNTGVFFVLMMCWLACSAQSGNNSMYDYSAKVDSVLSLMTLDEKIGKLCFIFFHFAVDAVTFQYVGVYHTAT